MVDLLTAWLLVAFALLIGFALGFTVAFMVGGRVNDRLRHELRQYQHECEDAK